MKSEFFKGIVQWEFDWRGKPGRLPVFYFDNTSMTAIYTASTEAVKKLLPKPEMKPLEFYPGRCVAAFTAFEYRKTDIDPYNEFSISFLISMGKSGIPGLTLGRQMMQRCFTTYVWQLPVTTEIARVGGVDLYGYPKFLADIVFERGQDWIDCKLSENGRHILTLGGKMLKGHKSGQMKYSTYSVKDGIPLKANVLVNPIEFAQTRNKNAAKLELGDHEISQRLKEIKLSKTPMMFQYSAVNEAILFGGRNLVDE